MCGIAGFYVRKPIKGLDTGKLVDTLVDMIDWRGGEATGMALFDKDGLILHQRPGCDAKTFSQHRKWVPTYTRTALLHTRLATQGHPAFIENNHPVVNGGVFVTHNGHISNDREIWYEIGMEKREAEVDSEAIPAWIAQNGWENATKALEKFEGSMAIAAVSADHPDELLLAKGEQSPLVYYYNDSILIWASTEIALLKAWGTCIGTPPKGTRLRQMKMGDWLMVKDGEITTGKFEVAIDPWRGWAKYNTTGASSDGFCDAGTGYEVTTYYKGGKKRTKKVASKTVDEWLKERHDEELEKANVAELTEEVNTARARTEEIMKMPEGWWKDEEILAEFNGLWDRIRVLRSMIEDRAWEEFDNRADEDEEGVEIQCPGCYNLFPIEEMQELDTDETGALYCWDCADEWNHPTVTNAAALPDPRQGELQWKTIAPGTEIMVLVNDAGDEIDT